MLAKHRSLPSPLSTPIIIWSFEHYVTPNVMLHPSPTPTYHCGFGLKGGYHLNLSFCYYHHFCIKQAK